MVNRVRLRPSKRCPFERKDPEAKARWIKYIQDLERNIVLTRTANNVSRLVDNSEGKFKMETLPGMAPTLARQDPDESNRGNDEALRREFSLRDDVPSRRKFTKKFSAWQLGPPAADDESNSSNEFSPSETANWSRPSLPLSTDSSGSRVEFRLGSSGKSLDRLKKKRPEPYYEKLSLESERLLSQTESDDTFPSLPSSSDDMNFGLDSKTPQNARESKLSTIDYNSFSNFLKKSPEECLAQLAGEEKVDDTENDDEELDEIASKFAKWVVKSELRASSINKEFIKQLFSVKKEDPGVNSTEIVIRELFAVPDAICQKFDALTDSLRVAMRRQILWDQIYFEDLKYSRPDWGEGIGAHRKKLRREKTKKMAPAFGWFVTDRIPDKLMTTQALWEGFTKNQIVQYCTWLTEHPHIQRPRYLIEAGYFEEVRTKSFQSDKTVLKATYDPRFDLMLDRVFIERFIPRWSDIQKFAHAPVA